MAILSLLLLLFPSHIELEHQNQIVFWNVGQGQWVTVIDSKSCYHFDIGGEFFNPKKISESCVKKENKIFYSHWDWDHIGLTSKIKNFPNICIAIRPQGIAKKYKIETLKIPSCEKISRQIKKLNFTYINKKTDNDLSHIFLYKSKLLLPGDSTKKMERLWSPLLNHKQIKWLSVSHHGSKTSTSDYFLDRVKIAQAIVSARKKVYGHPHLEVTHRLKKRGIPTLNTEDWGNIKILTH